MEEDETPKKSQALSQPLMDLFWELSEIDQSRQIEATAKLIGGLREQVDQESKDGVASQALEYTLNRLIRGLASNRKGARWGFGTALTVLLHEFPEIKLSKVLLELEQQLKIDQPNDMKTIAVGQLTVYMALVNSGRIQTAKANHLHLIVDNLLKLEREKTYLRAGSHEILMNIIEKIPAESFQRTLLPCLKGHLSKSFAELDLDGLLLLLRAFQFHQKAMEPVLKLSIGTTDLLDVKNIPNICKLLFQTSTRTLHNSLQEFCYAFQARPHNFPPFWKEFIDSALRETPWKAKIPFEVLPALLKKITQPKQLNPILTQQFLCFLLRNSVKPLAADSESIKAMHETATTAITEVIVALKATKNQGVIIKTLNHLLSDEAIEQTSHTWSSFVITLIRQLDAQRTAKVANHLVEGLGHPTPHREQITKILQTILHEKIKSVEDVARLEKLIRFFGREVFEFDKDKFSASTVRGFMKYLASTTQDHYRRKDTLLMMGEVEIELELKCAIMEIFAKETANTLPDPDSPEKNKKVAELKEKSSLMLQALDKLRLGEKLKPAFQLFALSTVGIWIKVKPALGEELLTELTDLIQSLAKQGNKLTDEIAAGKLLSLLLTLLAVEATVFGIISLIFKALCPFLNEEAISMLFDLVEPVEEGMKDDEEGMPIEFESSDGEEEEEDDDSDIEEMSTEPADLAIEKAALRQTSCIDKADEDAESEPDLDDAAMFQLDEVLANIMRSRKADKNGLSASDVDSRFRALRLVHTFFCFQDADPLVILPFLRSVICILNEKVQPSQKHRQSHIVDVCGKILLCLKSKRRFNVEKIRAATSLEDMHDLLQEVMEETGKITMIGQHMQCMEAVLFVQRIMVAAFIQPMKREDAVKKLRKMYLPGLEKLTAKRTWLFGHLLWNTLLSNLGEFGVGLIPGILELIFSDDMILASSTETPTKEPKEESTQSLVPVRKYLMLRQVQLCDIVKSIMKGQARDTIDTGELTEFFTKFGTEFLKMLKTLATTEGDIKGKKLFEDSTTLARQVMIYDRKQRKHGIILPPLGELWNFQKMAKWVDVLLKDNEKLQGKDLKALRQAMHSFRLSLDGHAKQLAGDIETKSTESGNKEEEEMET